MENQASNEEHIQILDGRQYYDNEKIVYVLPHDTDECGRLEKQHRVFKFLLQRNFSAPIRAQLKEGITVLDSGCGPGSWTIDMAKEFPNSKFHGVDISNFFPETKPDNCEFVIGNLTETLPYEDNTFDYIHQRLLILGLTNGSWDKALKELLRVLKPGGYIEIAEPNLKDLPSPGPLLAQLHAVLSEMVESRDIPANIAAQLKDRITEAGYINLVEVKEDIPLNHSGKGGEMIWDDYYHAYMNLRPMMTRANSEWEEVEAYQNHLQKCADEAKANKSTFNWHIVFAQKSLN
ncbi:S-adenosyl-L-methionine-dependent methyltransferase [Pilaira anomala]|nr:S-adenosyl-L-methionine-dependent methyltransferase [Pilaira anomala]